MLSFKTPEISDKKWADECFSHAASMNCEYTFGNIFLWKDAYSTEICRFKNFFICRWKTGNDLTYSLPLGEGDFTEAVREIINDAHFLNITPRIYGITSGYIGMLKDAFTGEFKYECDPANADYIYLTQKMALLKGKKYHSKRNHITNFEKNNPDWKFEKITDNNIDKCIEAHLRWLESKNADEEDITEYSLEFQAVLKAFENYGALQLCGGIISVCDEVVAFTLGEAHPFGNCFVTHFEKAPGDIQGAFAIINREFTKNCLSGYEYVNREEDLGIPGLRKAKQSYYPEIFLEKSTAVYID